MEGSIGKPVIAIDVDSTLSDTIPRWCEVFNQRYGGNWKKDDIQGWNITDYITPKIDHNQLMDIFSEIWEDWKKMPTTEPNIDKVVSKLKEKGYRISIITKRRQDSIVPVVNWLNYNKIQYDDFICLLDDRPKTDFTFNYLVDDAYHYLEGLNNGDGRIGILMTQPWNLGFRFPYRISKLSDLLSNGLIKGI